MRERWLILAALTFARTAMGFQFQSVAAVSAPLIDAFQLSYAVLGTLIGLYLVPGFAVALPGGLLGQRFGDKRVVCLGLAAMALGGVLMGLADNVITLNVGRVLSGTGAVVLNVLLAKMVTDWFEDRELVVAMGVLISSWPLGIALALVVLPELAQALSWPAAMHLPAVLCAAALLLVAAYYRAPVTAKMADDDGRHFDLTRRELGLTALAGLVWTFFNVGLISVLAFAPGFLVATGYTGTAAAAAVSIVGWVSIPALPVGGWLAQRIGRSDAAMLASLLFNALAIWAIASVGGSLALFAAIGLITGPPGGLIMALPAEAARAERRAVAMGIYYTCYYIGMGLLPALAGYARDATGNPAAPLWFAGAMLIVAGLSLVAFRVVQARPQR
jgi:MFS family permease